MNALTFPGQSPAVRASRALRAIDVRKMCVRALALAGRKSLTLAAISAVALFAGLILGSYPITCTSATFVIGFVYLADSTQKGGKK